MRCSGQHRLTGLYPVYGVLIWVRVVDVSDDLVSGGEGNPYTYCYRRFNAEWSPNMALSFLVHESELFSEYRYLDSLGRGV